MARTTPAQNPRGEHSSTFSGGFCPAPDTVIPASVGRSAIRHGRTARPCQGEADTCRSNQIRPDRAVGKPLCAALLPGRPARLIRRVQAEFAAGPLDPERLDEATLALGDEHRSPVGAAESEIGRLL